ncbi:MAG: radical SAM protein [Candidatus Hydrogenedentes bacterium]|nr:radical SAM protein [Candidatus Hydrogenedentota bacterium]
MAHDTVLLVNPNRMRPPIGPVALDYLAAALTASGYEPVLCDLTFADDWQSTLARAIHDAQPAAVGITIRNLDDAYFASQDFVLEQTADVIRRATALSDAPVVLGGVGFSIAPGPILEYTGAHYGIAGEGERAFPDLLACLAAGGEPHEVPGAVFRSRDNGIVCVPPVPCNLAALAPSARRFADNARYFDEGGQAGIETKRGCDRPCVYCVDPVSKGRTMRVRPPEDVAAEFRALLDLGIDAVHLCDSEFNLPPAHAHAVCEALVRSGVAGSMRWYAYASPTPFDGDLARAMAGAGCVGINFGVDHADAAMLERLGRSHRADDNRRTAEACRDAGLAVMFDLLFGSPGETPDSIARAIESIRGLPVDRVGLSCGVRVYPGTPLAASIRAQGPIAGNPNLYGTVTGNEDLLRPVFYVDGAVGEDIHRLVWALAGDDPRFLAANPDEADRNYNYNDNSALSQAIRSGARGAYWDILRKLDG